MAKVGDQGIIGPEWGAPWSKQVKPKWNPMGCPGCGLIPEKVWGAWVPHAPGDLRDCRGG